jgi:hypothetical protein
VYTWASADPHSQSSVPPAGRATGLRPQPRMPISPRPGSSPTPGDRAAVAVGDCHLVRVERVVFARQPAPLIPAVFHQLRVVVRTYGVGEALV